MENFPLAVVGSRALVVVPPPKTHGSGGSRFSLKPKVKVTLLLKGNCRKKAAGAVMDIVLESAGKSYRFDIDADKLEVEAQAALYEGLVVGVEGSATEIFQLIRNTPSCCSFVYGEPKKKHLTVPAKDINDIVASSRSMTEFGDQLAILIAAYEQKIGCSILALLSRKKYKLAIARNPSAEDNLVTRTKEHFQWPVAHLGIMLLDHDSLKPERFPGGIIPDEPKTPVEFMEYISKAAPSVFAGVCFTTLWSSSAFIFRSDTDTYVTREAGIHVLVVIDKPVNIDAVIKRLWGRLALLKTQGLFLEVTRSGAILKKTFLDLAPVSVNHLDFGGKAVFPHQSAYYAPLCKKIPPDKILENPTGHPFNTTEFLNNFQLDTSRLFKLIRRLEKRPEIQKFARERMQAHCAELVAKELLKHPNATDDQKKAIGERVVKEFTSLLYHRKISPNTDIYIDESECYTVAYILANWSDFVGTGCCSPSEPEQDNWSHHAHFYVNKAGEPVIIDFSRGVQSSYRLCADEDDCDFDMPNIIPAEVDDIDGESGLPQVWVIKGQLSITCDRVEELMHDLELYYNYTGQITMLHYDPLRSLTLPVRIDSPRFMRELSKRIEWLGWNPRLNLYERCDPPDTLTKALTKEPFMHIDKLTGMTHQPFFKRDGDTYVLVQAYGYDADTLTFSTCDPSEFNVKVDATLEDAEAALQVIIDDLLGDFRYLDPAAGLSQALAAVLQSTTRASMDLAPGFEITSPQPGGGKGLLSIIIGLFCSPTEPSSLTYQKGTEEFEKVMVASYDAGYQMFYFANTLAPNYVEQTSLSQSLSTETVSGRILGASKIRDFPTNRMYVIEGVKLGTPSDLMRKLIRIGLDPAPNSHYKKGKGFPKKAMLADRNKYINLALTVMQGYINHAKINGRVKTDGEVSSYSTDWQFLVRETLVWLGQVDPARDLLASAKGELTDDRSMLIKQIVVGWYEGFNSMGKCSAKDFVVGLSNRSINGTDPVAADLLAAIGEHHPASSPLENHGVSTMTFGKALSETYSGVYVLHDTAVGLSPDDACYLRLMRQGQTSPKKYLVEVLVQPRDAGDPNATPTAPVTPSNGPTPVTPSGVVDAQIDPEIGGEVGGV